MNKKLIIATFVFLAVVFYVAASHGLVMGPARLEVSLPPGEIAEGDYYVQNDTDQDAHIVVEPELWFKDVYNYGKLDIKDWVEFDTYEFDLKPKEIKKLRLKIKVPVDVKGELVAQIFFTSAVLTEDKEPAGIKARIGGVLYVAIKGTEMVDAEIKNIYVSKEGEKGKEKIKVASDIYNKGNVHLRPTGKVIIVDESGKNVVELDLVSGKPVLPGQGVEYQALWDNPTLTAGAYKTSVMIIYGKELDMEKTANLEKPFEVNKDGKVIMK